MMRLKRDVNIPEFIKQVEMCRHDVFLKTDEDSLDLKSTLSQYVFVVLEENEELRAQARVICDEEDLKRLEVYLEA